jgi:hypothetical protein
MRKNIILLFSFLMVCLSVSAQSTIDTIAYRVHSIVFEAQLIYKDSLTGKWQKEKQLQFAFDVHIILDANTNREVITDISLSPRFMYMSKMWKNVIAQIYAEPYEKEVIDIHFKVAKKNSAQKGNTTFFIETYYKNENNFEKLFF